MYLCIDLDAFFVSVEQALNPFLIGKPVVVGGLPTQRGVIASASYEARRFGIHAGMPTAQAYRLCPQAIFLKGNFQYYQWYSSRFYDILNAYSPEVFMASIDEAYINISGTERLFGPPLTLAKKIKGTVKTKLNIIASCGIARTKVLAKIVCNQSKPNGLLIVSPENEVQFLSPLVVDVLPGIGPRHREILRNLNINTVREFLQTPDWILHTALGNYYRVIKFFIYGGDFEFRDGMKSISRETTLPEDTIDKNLIYALFYYLLERGCTVLREKNLAAKIVTIKVRFSDFKTITRRITMPAGNAQQRIFKHGLPVLENLLKEKKRIRLIGINLSKFEYDRMQPSMFAVKEERLNRLNYALDRIRDKFGFNSLSLATTFVMKKHFGETEDGYTLHTPSLSQ
jgi:DNA polymerase-4